MTTPPKTRRGQLWLGMLVSLISLVAIFLIIDPAEILEALKSARYGYLLLCFLGVVVFMYIRAVRWRFMLDNAASYPKVFHIQSVGYMLNMLLPFRLGDVARAVMIGSVPPLTISRGITTMVIERVLDLAFIIILLPITLSQVGGLPVWMESAVRLSGILSFGALIVLAVAANQRERALRLASAVLSRLPRINAEAWQRRVGDLLAGLNSLAQFRKVMWLAFLSALVWAPIVFAYRSALQAAHIEPTWAEAAFVVCAAAFSVAAPSSPGQIGVFHAGVIAALTFLGKPEAQAASFAFLYHALNVLSMVLLGGIGLMRTGATFSQVVASARGYAQRSK